MREGYEIEYQTFMGLNNCLLVDCIPYSNKILLTPYYSNHIKEWIEDTTIGVWRIKSLK